MNWPSNIVEHKRLLETVKELQGESEQDKEPANEVGFREKFEAKLRTTDGHYVRSKAEMLIDNWLYMSEIVHAYERKLPIEEDVYCDLAAVATLRSFPTPDELCRLQPEDIITKWKKLMKRHAGYKKACMLIELAKRTVGTQQAIDAHKLHLKQLLEEYDLATTQLKVVEEEAIKCLKKLLSLKRY